MSARPVWLYSNYASVFIESPLLNLMSPWWQYRDGATHPPLLKNTNSGYCKHRASSDYAGRTHHKGKQRFAWLSACQCKQHGGIHGDKASGTVLVCSACDAGDNCEHENICKFTHVQHDIWWWHKYVSTEPELFCVFVSSGAHHQHIV